MTVSEARKIIKDFDENKKFSEDDEFVYIEALRYLIDTLSDPRDMMYLGGYYYEKKNFDLALKYYEMAASMDYDPAYEGLAYIWYYGRTGERNYEKAFTYFSKLMDKGNPVAAYKVADMYKNGYYVERNQEKYEQIIEELYPRIRKCTNVFDPVPEVCTRLARIRSSQGKGKEAISLYLSARTFLEKRISLNAFFGNLSIMKWMIDDLYELMPFDKEDFSLYDLFYLLKTPHKIIFMYEKQSLQVESVMEGDECVVCFDGKWFHDRDEFFKNACVGEVKLTALYDSLYGFEVIA